MITITPSKKGAMKGLFSLFIGNCLSAQSFFPSINPEDVIIIQDEWGVPYIYSKIDVGAVYGFAWPHVEDDFQSIEEAFGGINRRLSEVQGPTLFQT